MERIQVETRFFAPVQNGPGAHAASYTMGTESLPGKRPGRGVKRAPPSSAEVEERVEVYLYSPSGPSWPVLGRTLTFTSRKSSSAGSHYYMIFRPGVLFLAFKMFRARNLGMHKYWLPCFKVLFTTMYCKICQRIFDHPVLRT